ncbi:MULTISPECIES: hypothetical protein [Pseudanabaena]|uniref:hypothetical protein n=1 Tax=Pseudanabaena TaxID=1152 RepID=UPI00247AE5BC|nr:MULTISPECIES: hypothetical protein [Pseudanabaena]MEA5486299.1 hypothetical protein [Pseudanabaena sp. CCNP1317]WGS71610.1 hypothetical protein OA858_18140 [Pseudanabaena galeata CCNP1313]
MIIYRIHFNVHQIKGDRYYCESQLLGDRFDGLSCKISAIADPVILFVTGADIFG